MYQPIPDSTIRLCKNIPLDKSYSHTILWESEAGALTQEAYFASKTFRTVEKATYIRETGNIWIEIPRDELTGVNYLAYRNTTYTNKWFYAFVDEMLYKNDNCTEIRFVIDVMQTYLCDRDWTAKSAYIEREHVRNDDIGANILPEPIQAGERVAHHIFKPALFNDWDVVAFSGVDANLQPIRTQFEPGQPIYNGLVPVVVASGRGLTLGNITAEWNVTTHTDFLDRVIADPERDLSKTISNITMIPSVFASQISGTGVAVRIDKPTDNSAIGADTFYIPRNNKLYTKQYTSLFVTDGSGGGKEFAFEDFNGSNNAEFTLFCDKAPTPSIIGVPKGYRCNRNEFNPNESVIMQNLPQCAWNSDGFAAWFGNTARSAYPYVAAFHDAGSTVLRGANADHINAQYAAIHGTNEEIGRRDASNIAEAINKIFPSVNAAKDVPVTNGSTSPSAFMAIASKALIFYTMTPKSQNAAIIDDFFDRYGYAVNKLGVPDLRCRNNYKYIKTREIQIDGGAPAEALRMIQSIFNSGITFWYYPENVGDYTVNNDPI